MAFESGLQGLAVGQVGHDKFFAVDQGIAETGGEVIVDNDPAARFAELPDDVAADVAAAAGDEEVSGMVLSFMNCLP